MIFSGSHMKSTHVIELPDESSVESAIDAMLLILQGVYGWDKQAIIGSVYDHVRDAVRVSK